MNYKYILENIVDKNNNFSNFRFYKFIKNDNNFNNILNILKKYNIDYEIDDKYKTRNNIKGIKIRFDFLVKILKGESIPRCPICNEVVYGVGKTCNKKECKLELTKQTNLKKYGVENVFQNEKIKENIEKIMEDRYGGTGLSSNVLSKKIKETNFKKYGVENVFQNEEIKETNLKKYGTKNPFQNKYIKDKIKKKLLKEYGVEFNSQRKDVRKN